MRVRIVTSGHWDGDPRLNRHLQYLTGSDADVSLEAPKQSMGRVLRLAKTLQLLITTRSDVVVLPDPELFVLGSIAARMRGARAVIDIHEDYAKAVESRDWIPKALKPLARFLARINDAAGRKLAHATMVAAESLATPGAVVVLNVPDPSGFDPAAGPDPANSQVVYIGDVTLARGALEIADLAARLPEIRFVVVGKASERLQAEMMERAGADSSLELTGRLPHSEAWAAARGSIAGLSLLRPLPAYLDATATKLWEYAASGIPPVVTDLPGQRRFVEDIDDALAGSSVSDIEAILRRLSTDESFRRRVSLDARKMAEDAWSRSRPDLAVIEAVSPDRSLLR